MPKLDKLEKYREAAGLRRRVVEVFLTNAEWDKLRERSYSNGRSLSTEVAAIIKEVVK